MSCVTENVNTVEAAYYNSG